MVIPAAPPATSDGTATHFTQDLVSAFDSLSSTPPNPFRWTELMSWRAVNCSNHLIKPRSLSSILSFANYVNMTPNGTSYTLPFQNIKSRATVRVVDFFPSELVDFAVPCPKLTEYAVLSDADDSRSGSESESQTSGARYHPQRDEIQWEWRFGLVLEDAMGSQSEEKESMIVYVAGQDAECLLKLDAEK